MSRWWTATSTYVGVNSETGNQVLTLHPVAAIGGYFLLLFAVAIWPTRTKKRPINVR